MSECETCDGTGMWPCLVTNCEGHGPCHHCGGTGEKNRTRVTVNDGDVSFAFSMDVDTPKEKEDEIVAAMSELVRAAAVEKLDSRASTRSEEG